jgi:acetolactate synthase-1/2/3 large subunit
MHASSNTAAHGEAEWLTGAELTVRLLERQGVRVLSGIPGGAILPFYDALSASTEIHHVLARHEQGAGFIAQARHTAAAVRRSMASGERGCNRRHTLHGIQHQPLRFQNRL